jgi:antitoxin (DNA-binding transcriptional repressor) of toxin-antitoxin stability system
MDHIIEGRTMKSAASDETIVGVTAFKAQCLALIDDVARGKTRRVVLMKHNRPVAAIVPGADLTQPTGEVWEAES